MLSHPDAQVRSVGLVVDIFYDERLLLRAALYLHKYGAAYLRELPIGQVKGVLKQFITDHLYMVSHEVALRHFKCCYGEHLSNEAKVKLIEAMAKSSCFVAPHQTTLFPLVPIRVEAGFDSAPFFVGSATDLPGQLKAVASSILLAPNSFPPIIEWRGRRHSPTSWLGVRTPVIDSAKQMRAAILGAMALLPHHFERYSFSHRDMFGGHISFSGKWSIAMGGDPHTPSLMTDLVIGVNDRPWLNKLAEKLVSPKNSDKRQVKALEYYYRAWVPDPVKRFPTLFAAIDAIFGDAAQATQAVVDAVGPVMGSTYNSERVRRLLGLRASVIHGGAPNVYESSKYSSYYELYEVDPTVDLDLIVARCLQAVVFPNVMSERPHTHADLILEKMGRAV
jgi:hypothetical protein